MLGKIEGRRRRGPQRWLDGITDSVDRSLSSRRRWRTGSLACCSSWGRRESDTTKQLSKSNDNEERCSVNKDISKRPNKEQNILDVLQFLMSLKELTFYKIIFN